MLALVRKAEEPAFAPWYYVQTQHPPNTQEEHVKKKMFRSVLMIVTSVLAATACGGIEAEPTSDTLKSSEAAVTVSCGPAGTDKTIECNSGQRCCKYSDQYGGSYTCAYLGGDSCATSANCSSGNFCSSYGNCLPSSGWFADCW